MFQNYNEFINYLFSLQDLKYKEFNKKLIFTKYEIIGIQVPRLRKIAKEIINSNYKMFLDNVGSTYFEEVFIEGLVIASLPESELMSYLPKFILKIDNWSICDSFCNSLKIIKSNPSKYFEYFSEYIPNKEEFTVRVALVVFLNFYVDKEYLYKIFELIDQIKLDKYYTNMAIAWLLAEMFIKYPEETKRYLTRTKINNFTFNKTISKINDSYRASEDVKIKLKELRRK
ncbi:MAG: DNA alkylation repair protein [Bacilli bacterium]|nr:DNA alkylation repair protein [Bacilli bacterium]